jgi:hypothetical protein
VFCEIRNILECEVWAKIDCDAKMAKGGAAALLVLVVLMVAAVAVLSAAEEPPAVLVFCPLAAESCLTFGFSFPGPGSLLAVEGEDMKNGYVLWAETINNATEGIATKYQRYNPSSFSSFSSIHHFIISHILWRLGRARSAMH